MKFKSDIEVQAGLRDGGNDIGTAGQLLSSTGTVTNWIDQAEVVAAGATSVLIACKNTSGGTITKGTPVYQTGNVGATDVITVAEADALISTGYLPAIGLLETDLINNAFGHVVITGELLNITTKPIDGLTPTTGDTIYLKSGGGLTLTKPTGEGNAIQNLGLVGKVSVGNAGSLTVASIMRANDVPNLPEGRIWIGDGNTIVSDTVYVDEPNNRVGINTATPIYDLDVDGGLRATSWSYFSTDGPTSIAQLGGGTTTTSQFNITSTAAGGSFIAATNTLSIKANNTTAIKIDNAANVGIGTTSPSTVLEVSSSGVNGVDISQSASNATQSGRLFFTTNTASEGFALFNANGTFQVNSGGIPNDTSGTNRISIIGSSGKVGIGTTSPQSILHVSDANPEFILEDTTNPNKSKIKNTDGSLRYEADYNSQMGNSKHQFFIDGSEKLRITSAGNVGIGTTSPSDRLEVAAANSQLRLTDTDDSRFTQFSYSSGKLVFRNNSTTTTTNQFTLDLDGNMGIGTTSPNEKLEVNGSVRVTGAGLDVGYGNNSNNFVQIGNGRTTNGFAFIDLVGDTTYSDYGLRLVRNNGGANTNSEIIHRGTGFLNLNATQAGGITLKTSNVERVRVNSSGSVGIGITNPQTKLHLGTVSSSGTTVEELRIETGNSGGFGGEAKLWLKNGNYGVSTIGLGPANISGNPTTYIKYEDFDNKLYITTNSSTRIFIDNSGNVGVGTVSPSYKLDVLGDGRFTNGTHGTVHLGNYGQNISSNYGYIQTSGSLRVNGSVKVSDDTNVPSSSRVGSIRYRTSGNNSYVDMMMQTGASTYAWVNIVTNSW